MSPSSPGRLTENGKEGSNGKQEDEKDQQLRELNVENETLRARLEALERASQKVV